MKISASVILTILCSSASSASARLVRIVNRNGEDSLESVRGDNNNKPDALVPPPRIHISNASASIASPFGSSDEHVEHETGDQAISDPPRFTNHSPRKFPAGTSSPLPIPDNGTLRLFGLDPSVPLTKGERTFLEDAIRDTFNKIHQEHGIDRVVNSVSVNNDIVTVSDISFDLKHSDGSSSSSSSNRSLLRGSRKLPWSDNEMAPTAAPTEPNDNLKEGRRREQLYFQNHFHEALLKKLKQKRNWKRFQMIQRIQFLG